MRQVMGLAAALAVLGLRCESNEDCRRDPRSCDDADACTDDVCDMETGQCRHSEKRCNDNNPCTVDSCDPDVGCVAPPVPCDPSKGAKDPCVSQPLCNDGNPCATRFFCQEGACAFEAAADGTFCRVQGDHCQPGACARGKCVKDPTFTCDDDNPCTTDSCDPEKGCLYGYANGLPCDDGDPCTTDDACSGGECLGTPVECDDQDDTTADACDTQTGQCVHTPAGP